MFEKKTKIADMLLVNDIISTSLLYVKLKKNTTLSELFQNSIENRRKMQASYP